jgi:hypothetical protein
MVELEGPGAELAKRERALDRDGPWTGHSLVFSFEAESLASVDLAGMGG